MAEIEKLENGELEKVAGGSGGEIWVTVRGLETGYLALRTKPVYDYNNEIRGSESYNGQKLQFIGNMTTGADGKQYVRVCNPRTGKIGWVNAAFIG